MAYRREAVYPCKFLVGFTQEQREALEVIAERDKRPIAGVVRACVDEYLQRVEGRRCGRRSDRRAKR
ncbi:MAG: hypothetical protein F4Y39_08615 [Gemmatimonadetes bacterium]|nr:hypothetical protein [Gemmatimonadota bacterium]MYK51692.1 hypothetical protein [Gemmatimonadota bacterium]